MYLTEKYLEILQNVDVEEPKPSQHKNGSFTTLIYNNITSTCIEKCTQTFRTTDLLFVASYMSYRFPT